MQNDELLYDDLISLLESYGDLEFTDDAGNRHIIDLEILSDLLCEECTLDLDLDLRNALLDGQPVCDILLGVFSELK